MEAGWRNIHRNHTSKLELFYLELFLPDKLEMPKPVVHLLL